MTDSEMLVLLEDNPSEGLRAMIEAYSSFVYAIVYSKLGRVLAADDIEDFVSLVFSRVYEKRGEIDLSRGSLKGWLSTLSKRMSIDAYRRQRARVQTEPLTDEQAERLRDGSDLAEEAERKLDGQALAAALQRLERQDREVLVRRYYYGQKAADVARAMHMTEAAVRKRASRALEKVRMMLTEQGEIY